MFAIDGLVINSTVFPKTHNNKDKYGCSFKNNGKFGKTWIESVFPSDANFILIRVDNSLKRYMQLLDYGIVVRNSSKNIFCENTLRITVGLKDENEKLLFVMRKMENL